MVIKSLGRTDLRRLFVLLPALVACNLFSTIGEAPTPVSTLALPVPEITSTPASAPEPTHTPSLMPTPTSLWVASIPEPEDFQWVLVASDFQRPVDLAHAGDKRLFVVEQRGVIYVIEGGQVLEPPFLDIRERVNDRGNEQGLLGLTFHPDYKNNGFFYVNYTDVGGRTAVSRFQVSENPNQALADSEEHILNIDQPFANHNGGGLKFGPDGFLYIGMGDGGSGGDPRGNGQRLDTLLGKMLRIDVDAQDTYAIPAENPFASGGGRGEIWAYGLRNPWRFSFDSATGDLYIADVGQRAWEEVNFQAAASTGGENYGWNIREGAHPFSSEDTLDLIDPFAEYSHDAGCSVTGGVVVRNASLPTWRGVYLYADYCSGIVWGALRTTEGAWEIVILYETDFRISSFGEGADGEIYLLDHGSAVYRLEPRP
ncbi:MAG: PQQ-dependent sugar dehydrogenase [Chloroflexi bacterium]|nr:PQQ-dependent sugar dehydrogenase [Chloroflexota bacterium]